MILIMFNELFADIAGVRVLTLEPNEPVFDQGDAAKAIFQIEEGSVALVRNLADGAMVTIAVANAGETFAEASLFATHYHCAAVARSRSRVLAIPSDAVRTRLKSDPNLASELAAFLAGQVRDLRARIELQRIKRAPERVLAWLQVRAKGTPPQVASPASWAQVATEIALTPEALYRALSTLEKAGRVRRDGAKVTLSSSAD